MELDKLEREINITSKIVMTALIAIPIVYFAWFFLKNNMKLSISTSDWGSFGDFFGGILNPLIAFFAFFWLTRSIKIQKQELMETKEALVGAGVVQANQAEIQKKQRFEDTFFSLLEQHNIALSTLLSNISSEATVSVSVVNSTVKKRAIKKIKKIIFANNVSSLREAKKILMENNHIYGHYFRVLYQLLKFIATDCPFSDVGIAFETKNIQESTISREEKTYSNIIRAFLDDDVTQLLAVNCYCESEDDSFYKFKLLIERYQFLEHMPFLLEQSESKILAECITVYAKNVFGENTFLRDNPQN